MLRALVLSVAGLAAAGCQPPAPGTKAPDVSRAEDARSLPGFAVGAEDGELERFYVEIGDAPTRGPKDAAITIVMFSDFECPFCVQGHRTVESLMERYPGKIRFAYKAFPLDMHANALLAAMAARTAQAQGKFWEFHDLLFSQRGLEPQQVFAYAEQVGIDVRGLVKDLDTLEYGPEVGRDLRQARRLGVRSTPTFFVNGRQISGAQPLEDFEAVVDEELALVEQWLAEGTAAEAIYARAIAEGYRRVAYTQRGRELDPDGVFVVPLADSPRRGPDTAPVTIVVFGDFECPFCARGNEILGRLATDYGDKIRFVHKHHPLPGHSHAWVAARATIAAKAQGKFWAFHDALYGEQADFDVDDLHRIAKQVGLDTKKFRRAMERTDLDAAIEADLSLAHAIGVNGTPAFFVNGRPISGAQELPLRLLVEEELERAAAARARGVSPEQLYDVLTHQPLEE
jgi:protein-disulfide isomerase